jgi:HrpA-like RNA helicase
MDRLPQYCLHQLRALGSKKRIDVVQPSQIATYACGERLAVEIDSEYIRHLVTLSRV